MSFKTTTKILAAALIPLCGACSAGAEGFDETDSFETAVGEDQFALGEDPFALGEDSSAEGEEVLTEKATTVVWQSSSQRGYLGDSGWDRITSKRNPRSNSRNNLWGVEEGDSQAKVTARLKVLINNSKHVSAWGSNKIYAKREFSGIGSTKNIGVDGSGNRTNRMMVVLNRTTSGGLVDYEILDFYAY